MLPHEIVLPSIAVTGGTTVGVPIMALTRGVIKKLRVVQLSGALDGFSYCLYNTVAACQADGSALTLNSVLTPEVLYRITPLLVVASTASSYTSAEGYPEDGVCNLDLAYANMDNSNGTPLGATPSSKATFVYLKLIVAGTVAKTFGVALTILDPLL